MFGFTFLYVARKLSEKTRVHLARKHAELVDKGILCRIRRDSQIHQNQGAIPMLNFAIMVKEIITIEIVQKP